MSLNALLATLIARQAVAVLCFVFQNMQNDCCGVDSDSPLKKQEQGCGFIFAHSYCLNCAPLSQRHHLIMNLSSTVASSAAVRDVRSA